MSGSPPRQFGPFLIRREIARGGMGAVFEAVDTRLDRRVALKLLLETARSSSERIQRFEREIAAAGQLNHPHVVRLFGSGQIQGRDYFAMEFVEGWPFDEYVRRTGASLAERVRLLAQAADGLAHAHDQGVAHRDVKPANILVTREGVPKVTDFGLAKTSGTEDLTRTGAVLGTVHYMAPEQAIGNSREPDPRIDVFSLGVVLYEATTGQLPFQGDSTIRLLKAIVEEEPPAPTALNDDIPADLARIIRKAMEKKPGDRYRDAGALRDDLHRFLEGERIEGRSPSGLRRGLRSRAAVPLVAAALLFLVGAAIWFVRTPSGAETRPTGREAENEIADRRAGLRKRARTHLDRGELLRSREAFEELAGVDEGLDAEDRAAFFELLSRLRDWSALLEATGESRERPALRARLSALLALERYKDAVATADAWIDRSPKSAVAHCFRARAKTALGEWKEARADVRRAMRLAPSEPLPALVEQELLLSRGRTEAALGALNRRIRAADHPRLRLARARLMSRRNLWEAAFSDARRAADRTGALDACRLACRAALLIGRRDEALRMLQLLTERHRGPEVTLARARWAFWTEDLPTTEKVLEQRSEEALGVEGRRLRARVALARGRPVPEGSPDDLKRLGRAVAIQKRFDEPAEARRLLEAGGVDEIQEEWLRASLARPLNPVRLARARAELNRGEASVFFRWGERLAGLATIQDAPEARASLLNLALAHHRRAARFGRLWATPLWRAAVIARRLGDETRERDLLTRAIRRDPHLAVAFRDRGALAGPDAGADLQRAHRLDATDVDTLRLLARHSLEAGEAGEALDWARKGLGMAPESLPLARLARDAAVALGQPSSARRHARLAARLASGAREERARRLVTRVDDSFDLTAEQKIELLERALDWDPSNPQALRRLDALYHDLGRSHAWAMNFGRLCYRRIGYDMIHLQDELRDSFAVLDWDSMIGVAAAAAERHPEAWEPHFVALLFQTGRYHFESRSRHLYRAEQACEEALLRAPDRAHLWLYRGGLLLLRGHREVGLPLLLAALNPEREPELLLFSARFLAESGMADRAIEVLQEVQEKDVPIGAELDLDCYGRIRSRREVRALRRSDRRD